MSAHRIVIVVPSRGRPGNIAELRDAWRSTISSERRAELVVAIDHDDPTWKAYTELPAPFGDLIINYGPRKRLGVTLNDVCPESAAEPGVLGVGFWGDDHRPRTQDWDLALVEALQQSGPPRVVYGNDLVHGAALPTAVVMHSLIVRTLGRFVPEGMLHLHLDNYWRDLGRALGSLTYLPDVVIEHVHPITGKAEWDDGYRENNAADVWAHDEQLLAAHIAAGELERDAARILALCEGLTA